MNNPFSFPAGLTRYKLFRDILSNIEDFTEKEPTFTPDADVYENETNYEVLLDLPGMNKDNVVITLQDGVLAISGERKIDKRDGGRFERMQGKFSRSFTVSNGIDTEAISATFLDGVLRLVFPKKPEVVERERKKTISVS